MKNEDPNAPFEGRENTDGPRRDDTNRTSQDPSVRFAKDKRKRITRVEKNPGKFEPGERPAGERASADRPASRYNDGEQGRSPQERRSYNPNFTPDNKLRGGNQSYRRDDRGAVDTSKDDYFNSDRYNSREPREGRDGRDNRGYGQSSGGRGGSSYDRKPSYGAGRDSAPRGGGNYSNRPQSGGYSRDNRSTDRDNRSSDRGYGERKYGEGRPQGDRSYGQGDRNSGPGERSYGSGEKRYGDSRPSGQNRYGDNRPGGQGRFGDRKPGGFSKGAPRKGGFDQRRSQPAFDKENYPKYPRGQQKEEVRLNRYLSMSGICSRREADDLISGGLVTVNGVVVTEMGSKVNPGDAVHYNGTLLQGEMKVYIVMNKPKGYVTSLDDPHAEKTVMELLKNSVKERVYPVGRLDKNSMGVLLITNDGDMTKKLTHPSFEKKKIYQVSLDKGLSPDDLRSIAQGITLDDGPIKADDINYVNDDPKEIGIEIHSGRNRIVRRIFEHLGYQVRKLDRVYFAGLTKKNLKRGAWRFLTPREVSALFSGQYE